MSGECPRSDNFKRLDQAINSDVLVARALINIPMGKVDQLSWSTRLFITLERKSWKRVVLPAIKLLIQEISLSSRLIKKVDQENCQCDRGFRAYTTIIIGNWCILFKAYTPQNFKSDVKSLFLPMKLSSLHSLLKSQACFVTKRAGTHIRLMHPEKLKIREFIVSVQAKGT